MNSTVQEKTRITNLARYGTEFPMQSEEVLRTLKVSNLEKYGVSNVLELQEVRQKGIDTLKEKYGVTNPAYCEKFKRQSTVTRQTAYYDKDTFNKFTDADWLSAEHAKGNPIWVIAKQLGVSSSNLCKQFHKLKIQIKLFSASELETRLATLFTANGLRFRQNCRNLIKPKELDFVLLDSAVAIEVNGLYFHSEKFGKDSGYHQNKMLRCKALGYSLLQFWDYEINQNAELVVDYVMRRAALLPLVAATEVKLVSDLEYTVFFTENSFEIANQNITTCVGLFFQNEVVAVAAISKFEFNSKLTNLLQVAIKKGIEIQNVETIFAAYFNVPLYLKLNLRFGRSEVLNFTPLYNSLPVSMIVDKQGNISNGTQHAIISLHSKVWDCGELLLSWQKYA